MISDWECLNTAKAGSEAAWQTLVEKFAESLSKSMALITGSADSARDITQEAFIRLFKGEIKHRRGELKSYLFTIAYRLALKERKRQMRNPGLEGEDYSDNAPSPLEDILLQERDSLIVKAVNTLTNEHRDILVLRFYGGRDYREIAQITGVPLGTVKSRLFYAVKACREELKRNGVLK